MADLIDRDELFHGQVILVGTEDARKGVQDVMDAIWNAPAVDAEPVRHGHWIEQTDGCDGVWWDCSVCGGSWECSDGTPEDNSMRFCPMCGAKMDGGD